MENAPIRDLSLSKGDFRCPTSHHLAACVHGSHCGLCFHLGCENTNSMGTRTIYVVKHSDVDPRSISPERE